MGIGRCMARELAKELDGRSREFYELVMPSIDIIEEGNDLVVTNDLPGFCQEGY
jgi:HSP20 family molecular chaperone IbpA